MVTTVGKKKKGEPKPVFPKPMAEFAGELAPGPVTKGHENRMTAKVISRRECQR